MVVLKGCLDATRWLSGIHCTRHSSFILTVLLKTFLIPNHESQGSMGGSKTRECLGLSKQFFTHFRVHVVNLILTDYLPLHTVTDPF